MQRTELYVTNEIRVPMPEIQLTFVRSSGPGGQNVNKVNTKACLRWNIVGSPSVEDGLRERFTAAYRKRISRDGDVLIDSQRHRDQSRNATDCLNKLAEMLRAVARPPRQRRPTRPTRASRQRRLKNKKFRSDRKNLRKKPTLDD